MRQMLEAYSFLDAAFFRSPVSRTHEESINGVRGHLHAAMALCTTGDSHDRGAIDGRRQARRAGAHERTCRKTRPPRDARSEPRQREPL